MGKSDVARAITKRFIWTINVIKFNPIDTFLYHKNLILTMAELNPGLLITGAFIAIGGIFEIYTADKELKSAKRANLSTPEGLEQTRTRTTKAIMHGVGGATMLSIGTATVLKGLPE